MQATGPWQALSLLLTLMFAAFLSQGLKADSFSPAEMRFGTGAGRFHDVQHYAAIFKLKAPETGGASALELAVGNLDNGEDSSAFVSIGPVWRFHPGTHSLYLELGFSPTLVSDPSFGERELGGNLHFTSSATIGTRFGARGEYSVSLRVQHTSNGGLDDTNPGLDALALNFKAQIWSL